MNENTYEPDDLTLASHRAHVAKEEFEERWRDVRAYLRRGDLAVVDRSAFWEILSVDPVSGLYRTDAPAFDGMPKVGKYYREVGLDS